MNLIVAKQNISAKYKDIMKHFGKFESPLASSKLPSDPNSPFEFLPNQPNQYSKVKVIERAKLPAAFKNRLNMQFSKSNRQKIKQKAAAASTPGPSPKPHAGALRDKQQFRKPVRSKIREIYSYKSSQPQNEGRPEHADAFETRADKGTLANLESPQPMDYITLHDDNQVHSILQEDQEE